MPALGCSNSTAAYSWPGFFARPARQRTQPGPRGPTVIIAAQPTRGVDIGATEDIHRRLLEQRDAGAAILLISEDLDEAMRRPA
jgi:hypothetical protein